MRPRRNTIEDCEEWMLWKQANDCWYYRGIAFKGIARIKWQGKSINFLHLLWKKYVGRPITGKLWQKCQRLVLCLNPFHYVDDELRDVLLWKLLGRSRRLSPADMTKFQIADDDLNHLSIISVEGLTRAELVSAYGMTTDFGCYHCGERFDPLTSRNQVICDGCWSDADEEAGNAG